MKKYIYLKDDSKAYFLKYIKNANIRNYYRINPRGTLIKFIRRFKFNRELLWGNWKKEVNDYDTFILGENCYNVKFTNYIRKHNKDARIIVFFWNCVGNLYKHILDDKNVDEFWSYDKNDVEKYNMKYNTQLYSKNVKLPKKKIVTDIFFCGRDKGRMDVLNQLKDEFDKRNIKSKLIMIKKEKEFIGYEKYLGYIAESKAILDLFSRNQIGLSLRCMEALFFEKKLITNNLDIVNYEFYNPNNIFIIGKDDINNINDFLNSDYKKIDKDIVLYYDFENWLERFSEK